MIRVVACIVLASVFARSHCCVAADPSGASPPRPYTRSAPGPNSDDKRFGQYAVKRMVVGDVAGAIDYLNEMLESLGDDAELRFLLAVAEANAGRAEAAREHLDRALELGLPRGRLVAGPRTLHQPLRTFEAYAAAQRAHRDRPLHGPLVGSVSDRGFAVWVRTATAAGVEVTARRQGSPTKVHRASARSDAETDFTAVVTLDGLQADAAYEYEVALDGQAAAERQVVRTFPPRGESARFSVAFGGGAGYHPANERVWQTIEGRHPLALLLLGDNVYSDDPETPEVQRYCYYRRQSRPEFRSLVAQTGVFAIWDDHDFGTDDCWGGPEIERPAWTRAVWNVFRQNWANPAYGGGEEQPGVWYDFWIGDVHFFMLDGRYYRTDSGRFGGTGVERPTMLGPVQKAWLKDRLASSDATFKVIVSPVPWDFRAKEGAGGLDTWRGFATEREEIFSFLTEREIDGVVLMSADRHRSDAWRIEREGDYDLFEFNSSRLTNEHVHPTMGEALFSYNEKQSFGWVTFDTTADDPQVTYEIISIDDEPVYSLTVPLGRLRTQR